MMEVKTTEQKPDNTEDLRRGRVSELINHALFRRMVAIPAMDDINEELSHLGFDVTDVRLTDQKCSCCDDRFPTITIDFSDGESIVKRMVDKPVDFDLDHPDGNEPRPVH